MSRSALKIEDLRSRIDASREATLCLLPTNEGQRIDQQCVFIAERCGFNIDYPLEEIDAHRAEWILASILHRDMAYNYECMSYQDAEHLSREFLGLFAAGARFFMNGKFEEWMPNNSDHGLLKLSSWGGITRSTFDTGVICIDSNQVGILWFEDED